MTTYEILLALLLKDVPAHLDITIDALFLDFERVFNEVHYHPLLLKLDGKWQQFVIERSS